MSNNSKHSFKAVLPHQGQEYILKGCLHLRYGTFPGEVEVTSINDVPTQQILPGMPEIHYTHTLQPAFILPHRPVAASFTRKMDGTAILFSPLQLPNGDVVVFPRTRGMVVLQNTKWKPFRNDLTVSE